MTSEDPTIWLTDGAQTIAYRNRGSVDREKETFAGKAVRRNLIDEIHMEKDRYFSDKEERTTISREMFEKITELIDEAKGDHVQIVVEEDKPVYIKCKEAGTNHETEIVAAPAQIEDKGNETGDME